MKEEIFRLPFVGRCILRVFYCAACNNTHNYVHVASGQQ